MEKRVGIGEKTNWENSSAVGGNTVRAKRRRVSGGVGVKIKGTQRKCGWKKL